MKETLERYCHCRDHIIIYALRRVVCLISYYDWYHLVTNRYHVYREVEQNSTFLTCGIDDFIVWL